MPSLDTILAVFVAGFLLSLSPGPSMLYVLSRSLGQNTIAGLASSIGLALGGIALALITAFGLAAIVAENTYLFNAIQYIGAIYLAYLGIDLIMENVSSSDLEINEVQPQSFSRILSQGVLVELLNPKTILFFVAFLPQFISHDTGSIAMQFIILGMLVPLTAIPSDIVVAFAGGSLIKGLSQKPKLRRMLNIIGGLMLLALALRILIINL